MANLKYVRLVYENCDTLTIPGKYIRNIFIGNITKTGHGANLWYGSGFKGNCHSGWYSEDVATDEVIIDIVKDFLDGDHSEFGIKEKETFSRYDRLIRWNDITHIDIVNKEYKYKWVINPFKLIGHAIRNVFCFLFADYSNLNNGKHISITEKWRIYNRFHGIRVNSKHCFKRRIADSEFNYSVPWYWSDDNKFTDEEGKEHHCEDINKYQKVEILPPDENYDETCVRIAIKKED